MALPADPYNQGRPFPPPAPRDPNAGTVLDESERGKDDVRGDEVDTLLNTPAHPLTHDEKEAAEDDPGRPPRTFAPAEARVPVAPAPGHEQLIEEGMKKPISPEAALHPGDRSDPAEIR